MDASVRPPVRVGHGLLLLVTAALVLFFSLLYFADNKYQTPPPYGHSGVIELTEADLTRRQPVFLIDGWLLTDDNVTDRPTYIGEFSSLQRGDPSRPPHGTARYQLTLRYQGAPLSAAISFPQLFTDYVLSLDGQVLSRGVSAARVSFPLTSGDHVLTVETSSRWGYYSGLYHPPALAETGGLFRVVLLQCIAYGLAFFVPLALALFTLALWRSTKDRAAFWFGLLCCSFSLYISYYFVRLMAWPAAAHWYLVQSISFYALCFCAVQLTILTGGTAKRRSARVMHWILAGFPPVLVLLAVLIPVLPQAVWLHGKLTDLYYLCTFCGVLLLAIEGRSAAIPEHRFTQLSCLAFGTGLVLNLFFSNRFEPILFFWQFEWCGLFLVLLFGAMMASRNRRILAENEAFSNGLEILVEQRTAALSHLLQERKDFFADMAHDLKAPLFATKAFIEAIRAHNTGVDGELAQYLDLVEQKQQEMSRRVQGMSVFNQIDAMGQEKESVSVTALLREVYDAHHMAAEVASVHLVTAPPARDALLLACPGKLAILYENLIFNALRATPPEGRILLGAELDGQGCHLTVSDTGVGIPADELPHIFQRFFVGKNNRDSGSGLGLSIVSSIVEELGGEITVASRPGQGTTFHIDLPLLEQEPPHRVPGGAHDGKPKGSTEKELL